MVQQEHPDKATSVKISHGQNVGMLLSLTPQSLEGTNPLES